MSLGMSEDFESSNDARGGGARGARETLLQISETAETRPRCQFENTRLSKHAVVTGRRFHPAQPGLARHHHQEIRGQEGHPQPGHRVLRGRRLSDTPCCLARRRASTRARPTRSHPRTRTYKRTGAGTKGPFPFRKSHTHQTRSRALSKQPLATTPAQTHTRTIRVRGTAQRRDIPARDRTRHNAAGRPASSVDPPTLFDSLKGQLFICKQQLRAPILVTRLKCAAGKYQWPGLLLS